MLAFLAPLGRYDECGLHLLVQRCHHRIHSAMRALTHLGDAAATVPLALALLAAPLPHLNEARRYAAFVLTVSHLLVQLLKPSGC